MAEWIEPKTDWTASDYFNAEDYNRIIGNLVYLRAYLGSLFNSLTNVSLGEEKSVESLIYAREINAIEQTLEILNKETYRLAIGETKEYFTNQKTIDYVELNRIEKSILALLQKVVNHKENLTKIAFTLGNQKGIKV